MASRALTLDEIRATNRPVAGPVGSIPDRAEVVIVGAGPVGLTAANLLGALGIRTLVIERNAQTSDQPKAVIVDDEHLRLIDRMGLYDQIAPNLTDTPFGIRFYSPLGFELVRADGFVTPSGFGNRNSVSQPMLEKVLLAGTARWPSVTVCYRSQATDLSLTAEGIELVVRNPDGEAVPVQADYLLGCDGANSFVRKALDIRFAGKRIDEPHVVIDFAAFPDQSPFSRFFCNPRRPFNSILVPYGGRRIEFMLNPGDDRETITSTESIRALVARHTPYPSDNLQIVRSAVFGFSARIAERMRQGRVFLLGDAAHVMPPFGAQGLNTGARDAANLTWKIAAVLRGRIAADSLDSYDPERRPQIEDIVAYSVRIGRLANIRSWPLALLRDLAFAAINLVPAARRYFREMRYMPPPGIRSGLLLDPDPAGGSLVGRMMPRLDLVQADGRRQHIDALIGLRFALVGIDVDPTLLQETAHAARWRRLDPVLLSITLKADDRPARGQTLRLATERGRPQLAGHAGQTLVVRPDGHVAAAARPADMPALTARLMRLLGVPDDDQPV